MLLRVTVTVRKLLWFSQMASSTERQQVAKVAEMTPEATPPYTVTPDAVNRYFRYRVAQ